MLHKFLSGLAGLAMAALVAVPAVAGTLTVTDTAGTCDRNTGIAGGCTFRFQ